MELNLQSLNLESRRPKLSRIQGEVKSLEKRLRESESVVQQLQAELVPARNRDLDAEARAVRSGKGAPEARHEPEVKKNFGAFLQQHRAELFADVADARAKIAASVAEAAREALRGFARWSDMHYTLKSLQPPVEPADSTAPAQNISVVLGVGTTRSSGPDRGEIEQALRYLVSLASGPAQGGNDAAA